MAGEWILEAYDRAVPAELNLDGRYWDDPASMLTDFEHRCAEREKTIRQTLQHLQTR